LTLIEWALDPDVVFLNHGSFGACPRVVLAAQQRLRDELEREPVRFLSRELEGRLDAARAALAAFVGADPDDLAFVTNATTGVNTVLRSLALSPGDELVTTDHTYNACRNALDLVAARSGARVTLARVPFPGATEDHVVDSVLAAVTPRTRLALLDHVTSPTALVFPIARVVAALGRRGVDTLVDGAHAPGMVPLDLRAIGAAYYSANCHKWLCAPKGAAFLHVRRDRQDGIRPLVVSHGANSPRTDRSRFRLEFDWTGTGDPTAFLVVADALRLLEGALPGGWPALMARNRDLALAAREVIGDALGVAPASPAGMIGSLAAVPLPDAPRPPVGRDPLQDALFARHGIEVPVMAWPAPPRRLVRVSAQLYNTPAHYERLADALRDLLGSPSRPPAPPRQRAP
jgi:isopenicillin-N epimerase